MAIQDVKHPYTFVHCKTYQQLSEVNHRRDYKQRVDNPDALKALWQVFWGNIYFGTHSGHGILSDYQDEMYTVLTYEEWWNKLIGKTVENYEIY